MIGGSAWGLCWVWGDGLGGPGGMGLVDNGATWCTFHALQDSHEKDVWWQFTERHLHQHPAFWAPQFLCGNTYLSSYLVHIDVDTEKVQLIIFSNYRYVIYLNDSITENIVGHLVGLDNVIQAATAKCVLAG